MKHNFINQITLLIAVFICSGCAGTMMTRTSSFSHDSDKAIQADFFGRYPYSAVVCDYSLIVSPIPLISQSSTSVKVNDIESNNLTSIKIGFITMGIISIPLDIIFDTVLLPGDLIAWPLSYKKIIILP